MQIISRNWIRKRAAQPSRFEPISVLQIKETVIGPVTGGYEQDNEEDGTVDARTVEEVSRDEEEEDEEGRGVCGDKQEG